MEQSYKVHDGSWGLWMFPHGGGALATIQAIEGEWLRWQEVAAEGWFAEMGSEPEGPIKPVHWNSQWLPVTDAGSGNHFCVDLDPAPGGKVGQIIWFDHEVGPVRVVASGFAAWLEQYATALESGRYAYHPTEGVIDTQEAEPGAAPDTAR
ncbi:SMI1 / KNR4 family protein [Gemmata obscuriglobus]|nr:SMI1 / KNR4 family protein [Gemmata obscuriglobus]VTS01516.1 Cell wall assembly/cell proliferation coordinating protein, KNR4 OS=Chroococcidiopsis thermalis PCC 7203 GN=Chro_1735 PE=4 SV=1: SMI1_KNR4 [Gemmata obscuriglobus UQM 2246]